jgi:hypothetical protein
MGYDSKRNPATRRGSEVDIETDGWLAGSCNVGSLGAFGAVLDVEIH